MAEEIQSVLSLSIPEADCVLSHVRSHFDGEVPPEGTPAHITLLYPWMPPVLINETVLSELASLFASFPAFDFRLNLGWFGREVLLLVPEESAPFVQLTEAIGIRWPQFPYYGGEYTKIEPHVTLAYGNQSNLSLLAEKLCTKVPLRAHASCVTLHIGQPGQMIDRGCFGLKPV